MDDSTIYMFVDGACVPNPGKAAYAFLLDYKGHRKVDKGVVDEETSTNQRAEITAAIKAFEALKPGQRDLTIVVTSDSQYLIKSMCGEWRAKTNLDLFDRLEELSHVHNVTWQWVKGHSGHVQNEIVDKLANRIAEKAWRERSA